jgi:hypothetical protein
MTSEQSSIHSNNATVAAPSYLERGSTDHPGRDTEKSSGCTIAGDLLEPDISGNQRYEAKDDLDGGNTI